MHASDSQRGPPLEPWHAYVPRELRARELDATDRPRYVEAENHISRRCGTWSPECFLRGTAFRLRYLRRKSGLSWPFRAGLDGSYIREPQGDTAGAVVLLHGLTDSPFSLRHRRTLPRAWLRRCRPKAAGARHRSRCADGGQWEDWMAATRLAVREARRRAGTSKPLQIVGYSNGGALALKYALDALDDDRLEKADRLILISPMIGITSFARFVGLAALPAYFPRFAKAASLDILPEFNPFKYNSFPVNAAWQSHRLTQVLQEQIASAERSGKLTKLPAVLTFQSLVDFTVSTPAVVSQFYARLPPKIGELVLFDINRATPLGLLLRPAAETKLARILPPAPRNFRTTIITNDGAENGEEIERIVEAGALTETIRPLGMTFSPDTPCRTPRCPSPPATAFTGRVPTRTKISESGSGPSRRRASATC